MEKNDDSGKPPSDELTSATANLGRFDQILLDLRKYGFSFVTGLTTADGLVHFVKEIPPSISIGIIDVTMVLVAILYFMDTYYNTLLVGSWLDALYLERFRKERGMIGVSFFTGGMLKHESSKWVIRFVYWGLLTSLYLLCLLFLHNELHYCGEISKWFTPDCEPLTNPKFLMLTVSFLATFILTWVAYFVISRPR